MKRCFAKLTVLLLLVAAIPLAAKDPGPPASPAVGLAGVEDLSSYEKRVSVKTLPNGLTVVLWRRPEAPVFSFFTLVDAGSAQDPLQRNRAGAHDGAHGLQGHARHRHHRLRRREGRAGKGRADLCRV